MARQTPLENGKKYNTSINVAGIQMLAWSHNAGAYSCSKYKIRGTTIWPHNDNCKPRSKIISPKGTKFFIAVIAVLIKF